METKTTLVGYGLVSPLHIANFMAYYYSHPQQYSDITIYISNYWGKNIIPERYIHFLKSLGITVTFNDSNLFYDLNNKTIDIVFVGDFKWRVLLKFHASINSVAVVDEGLSSYRGLISMIRQHPYIKPHKYIISRFLNKTLLVGKKTTYFHAFSKNNLQVNESYKAGLFHFFTKLNEFYPIKVTTDYSNTVLFCSQPISYSNEETQIACIKSIQKQLEEQGLSLIIKRHPADDPLELKKYGIEILEDERILEELFFNTNFKALISQNSTSSFMVPALYGNLSYLLSMEEVYQLGADAKKLFKKYCLDITEIYS